MMTSDSVLNLNEKLSQEVDEASFEMLKPHLERGVVIALKPSNDLVQIGVLFADNKTHLIKGLLDAKELYRPTALDQEKWSQNNSLAFKVLIIAPFVLIQAKNN
jgi:hypothetical protein